MYKKSEVEKAANDYFNDSLVARVWLDKYALKKDDSFLELSPNDTIVRMAKELYRIENKYPNPVDYETIYKFMEKYHKFVLGGSCLFGIGNNLTFSTLGNCFVVDSPEDSYGGIFKTDQELAQLMKRRGGVGTDLSTLRPERAAVNNAANNSTGMVSFAERYSNTTREVAQDGRRGALMLTVNINHKDIVKFISCKDDLTKVTGANISVKVTDEFMNAVKNDGDFGLSFDKTTVYVKARPLWNKLIHQAWKSAEPGIIFWDQIIRESPADCYELFKTTSTNPCGELPLCPYDSCRLSAINIYEYVNNPFTDHSEFDMYRLSFDTILAQRLMDDIIDLEEEKILAIISKIERDPEKDETKQVEHDLWIKILQKLVLGRRTGLGQMGLGDAFAAVGLTYGEPKAIELAEQIDKTIAISSYRSSIIMAKERGAFPIWNYEKEQNNPYIERICNELNTDDYSDYRTYGRRNIANLTIAPTGTISMLAGVTSGIEPVFALSYTRKRKVTEDNPNRKFKDAKGDWWEEYLVYHPKLEIWRKLNPEPIEGGENPSPYYKACSHEIDPVTKLNLQAVIQPWIDHSISVTYNLHKDTKEEEISNLYFKAWELGLKGLTVYRDGCRDGVLNIGSKSEEFKQHDAPKRPKVLPCDIYNIKSKGNEWTVIVGLFDDKPYEVFATNYNISRKETVGEVIKVKKGQYDLRLGQDAYFENIVSDVPDDENMVTRLISTSLRHGSNIQFIVEQLYKSTGDITSFSKAIARVLKKYVNNESKRNNSNNCPNCNSIGSLVSEGGCNTCKQCGYSRCE